MSHPRFGRWRSITSVLAALLVANLRPAHAAGPAFAEFAPAETVLYLELDDVSALRANWKKTPFYDFWTAQRFVAFLKPLKDKIGEAVKGVEQEKELTSEALLEMFPSRVAVFLSRYRYGRPDEPEGTMYYNVGFMARFKGDKEKVREFMEKTVMGGDLPRGAERSVSTFKDVKIYRTVYSEEAPLPGVEPWEDAEPGEPSDQQPEPKTWQAKYYYEFAFVDDFCVLHEGETSFVKPILSNYLTVKEKGKAPESLASTPRFRDTLRPVEGTPAVLAYANLGSAIQTMLEHPGSAEVQKLTCLGLDAFETAAFTARLLPAGLAADFSMRTKSSPSGIAGLVVHDAKNSFRSQRMTPRDVSSYSTTLFDLGKLYQLIKTASQQAGGPFAEGFATMEAKVTEETGLRLYEDLFQHLGGEVAVFSQLSADSVPASADGEKQGGGGGWMLQLTREEGFEQRIAKALETVVGKFFEGVKVVPTDFQGFTVHSIKPKPGPGGADEPPIESVPEISFAVAGSYLIVGESSEPVKAALRLVKGTSSENVTQNETFRKMTARLKPGYVGLSWQDVSQLVKDAVQQVFDQPTLMFLAREAVNIAAMPTPEQAGRYFGQYVDATYTSRDSLHWTALLAYPEDFTPSAADRP